MDPQEAYRRRDEVNFLDVREWYEWEAGTVEGARHVPIGKLAARFEEVPNDRPVIVVCQVGQRSALAADFLAQQGYDAHNLEGGVEEWAAAGLPLVKRPGGDEGQVVDGWAQHPDLP